MSQNYKETLTLPQTNFPMRADLVLREPERLARWEKSGLYQQILQARAGAPLFVLHDGPPFANGDVHMGTALNKILKDLIVKSRSMLGFHAPFVPGWDCHGLPIEFKVVKESRGLPPAEVRRRSEELARRFIDVQRRQFRRLGILGEWEKPYLTLEPAYEAEIIRAFAAFVEQGLVYQSKKPVYWSTGAQTALAEAEVEYADRTDPAIFVKFPLVSGPYAGQASMVIWTTTPWTLPANVAVAVHPRYQYVISEFQHDSSGSERFVIAEELVAAFSAATLWRESARRETVRGEELAGSEAQHPFLPRTSRIITANFVTLETGTGQVHIAPGHGADDYLAGLENDLPVLSPVDDQGRFTADVGLPEWEGCYVFEANPKVVAHLQANGTLLGESAYLHSYPHCWRSKTPIVFRAVEQFFVRVENLRAAALSAIEEARWIPAWGQSRIAGTVESRPDWCISRQRTWGVPLPVFYNAQGQPLLDAALARRVADLVEREGTNLWFERDDAWWAAQLGLPEGTTRRQDTLDVWIDSGISHRAVLQKRQELQPDGATLDAEGLFPFRPADVYIEATDQHRGWFQSSLLTSVALHAGAAPYRTVITHGFVVDRDTRKKVSKSAQGTYVKPMEAEHFVGKHGADIVRLWAASVEFTNEVPFSEEAFAGLTDAYRQFRNVLRILLANSADAPEPESLPPSDSIVDRWILSRLQEVIATCREAYTAYDFRRVFQTLNQFVTVEVSSLYVDITKDVLYCDGASSPRRRGVQAAMLTLFRALCQLLAPILAFTADEAWEFSGQAGSIHLELFPEVSPRARQAEAEATIEQWLRLRAVVAQAIEAARQQKIIGKALEGSITLRLADPALLAELQPRVAELEEFFILSELKLVAGEGETSASVEKNAHPRCSRCWRHRASVGLSAAHPELCERCAEVVTALV